MVPPHAFIQQEILLMSHGPISWWGSPLFVIAALAVIELAPAMTSSSTLLPATRAEGHGNLEEGLSSVVRRLYLDVIK